MGEKLFLVIEAHDKHRLTEVPPINLDGYKQYGGPFASTLPFFTVFAKTEVSPDRVAEIASGYRNET